VALLHHALQQQHKEPFICASVHCELHSRRKPLK